MKGGVEALAHGARRFVDSLPGSHVFVKVDMANAFNSVRRDTIHEAVASHAPRLLGYMDSAYGAVSHLQFGDFIIESAEGIQQGTRWTSPVLPRYTTPPPEHPVRICFWLPGRYWD